MLAHLLRQFDGAQRLDGLASSKLIGPFSLAPVLKKVKHRLVENMSSGTADALGLSRAILCNGKSSFRLPAQLCIQLT